MSAKKNLVEVGSGNVFKDLGLPAAEQPLAKAELGRVIRKRLQPGAARTVSGLAQAILMSARLVLGVLAIPCALAAQSSGNFSAHAVGLWTHVLGERGTATVRSPDSSSSVVARWIRTKSDDDGELGLWSSGAIGTLFVNIGHGVGAELLWAPDSKAFFVSTSDEGANGAYRLLVVDKFGGRLAVQDITPLVYRTFGHPVRCGWSESPNVVGVAWIGQTHHVLVAAEIIRHSNCDSFGTFRAYEVDPKRMVVARSYGQLEAKRDFGSDLGGELASAPDECIRRPASCYVASNHGH